MTIFSQIALALQTILTVKADELAKSSGFIRRVRKITGANFIKTLVFGWMQNHPPSVEGLARAGISQGLKISAQGLHQRFSATAGDFVRKVLEAALAQVITAGRAVDMAILNRFEAIRISESLRGTDWRLL